MPARLEFGLSFGAQGAAPRRNQPGAPLRLLLLGDFSGGAGAALAARKPQRIDIDNFDSVLQRLAPQLQVQLGGQACMFVPTSLDDFHADRLLQLLPPLAHADDLRQRLLQPGSFAQAAAEIALPAAGGVVPAASEPAAQQTAADLLGSLLGGTVPQAAGSTATSAAAPTGIDALLQHVVAPHVVQPAPANQAAYVAAAEAALAEQLRTVLHHPAFQALEANWRGVQWLLSNLPLDDTLQLHLLDLRADELQHDVVAAQGRVEQSTLHGKLVPADVQQPGAQHWSALVWLHTLGADGIEGRNIDVDIALAAALGVMAAQAGAPLLLGAAPALLGLRSFADATTAAVADSSSAWNQLRRSEVAPWIAAAAPRLLMRLPYGKQLEPVQGWSFEEISGSPLPAQLLWAPGAFALARMLGAAYAADGWGGDPDAHRRIDDLPACAFTQDGEPALQPCAEVALNDSAAQALLQAGLVVLRSHRQQAAVQATPLRSVALPAQGLAGPWSTSADA